VIKDVFLLVQLKVQVAILLLPICEDALVVIYLVAKGGYEGKVAIYALLVVFFHAALIVIQTSEVVFKADQLFLEDLVISLALAELDSLLLELLDETVFMFTH
jgi:hypothetical protein